MNLCNKVRWKFPFIQNTSWAKLAFCLFMWMYNVFFGKIYSLWIFFFFFCDFGLAEEEMVFLIQFFPLQHFNIKTQHILIPRKTTCITVPKTTSGTTCSTSLCARQLILANKKRLLWLCKSNSYPTRLQRTDIWFNYQFQHGQSTKHWTLICVSWHHPVSPDSC